MMGEDSLVLARLVYTLGVILYAAINTPVSHYPKKADVKIETLSLFVYQIILNITCIDDAFHFYVAFKCGGLFPTYTVTCILL